jgi:hypothetical protein
LDSGDRVATAYSSWDSDHEIILGRLDDVGWLALIAEPVVEVNIPPLEEYLILLVSNSQSNNLKFGSAVTRVGYAQNIEVAPEVSIGPYYVLA